MPKTIQAVSAPRIHPTSSHPRAPLTAQEKKEKREKSSADQAAMNAAVAAWVAANEAKAVELGKQFDKTPRYFLDIFYQGGARMVNHHKEINPYNAFKSEKAAERREEGASGLKVQALHEEYKEEYDVLTPEEKKELVER
ncbi:hypothetical protein B0H12DRAFT_1015376 [Mycena haematopus]|nr:hypothetical protein B0H12DRAFT_1015376 [Mycena haematopus]